MEGSFPDGVKCFHEKILLREVEQGINTKN